MMVGSFLTAPAFVVVLEIPEFCVILHEDRCCTWFPGSDSLCVNVFCKFREHCRRFFLRWWGKLLRQAGGFSRSGTKAFCWPRWCEGDGRSPSEGCVSNTPVCALLLVPSSSSSDSEMVNLVRSTDRLRLWDRCRGLGSQKSELWRLARRLCCGLLNIIQ